VPRIRSQGLWLPWLVVATGLVVAYLTLDLPDWYSNLFYNVIALISASMIVVGVRRHRPSRPEMWYLFAGGQVLWALGDFTYGFYEHILQVYSFPAPADVLYQAGYVPLVIGLFILIRGRTSGRDRAGLIDALIVATGLGLLSWVFLMLPIIADDTLTPFGRLMSLAYPASDILMILMAVRLFMSPGAKTASYRFLSVALVLVLTSDIAYSVLLNLFSYEGGLIDGGWLMSYVFWATAALHPSMRSLSEVAPDQAPRISAGRLVMLALVSLLAPGLLFYQGFTAAAVDWVSIGIGSVVLFLLVLARLYGLVSKVQDQASQLAALAHNDSLTGVPNRRAWDLELAREMAVSRRTGIPMSIAMLDLDHFKRFNDQHGHQAGDRLLTQAAALWRAQLREQDYLARYGGEEFCVMVTGLAAEKAADVLGRLLAATPDGQTFSAGVASWDGVESPERLVARADEALYHAKRNGRNRVTLAGLSAHQRDELAAPPRETAPPHEAEATTTV
jgi:diguanylate cyclase (GGDEF)-like protein